MSKQCPYDCQYLKLAPTGVNSFDYCNLYQGGLARMNGGARMCESCQTGWSSYKKTLRKLDKHKWRSKNA